MTEQQLVEVPRTAAAHNARPAELNQAKSPAQDPAGRMCLGALTVL